MARSIPCGHCLGALRQVAAGNQILRKGMTAHRCCAGRLVDPSLRGHQAAGTGSAFRPGLRQSGGWRSSPQRLRLPQCCQQPAAMPPPDAHSSACLLLLLMALPTLPAAASQPGAPPYKLSIYAGSRGDGVPPAAMARLKDIERFLAGGTATAGVAAQVSKRVVGLEGETQLCVEMPRNEASARVLERLKSMVSAVPLLTLSTTPCVVR